MDIHNTERILPQHQTLQVGDVIPFWASADIPVLHVEPPSLLVLAGSFNVPEGEGVPASSTGGSWTFLLEDHGPSTTRLILRTRVSGFSPSWLSSVFYRLLLEPAHFLMERKMLLGIKARAEAQASSFQANGGA